MLPGQNNGCQVGVNGKNDAYCLACKWGVVDSHCDRVIESKRDWAEAITCTRGDEGVLVRALVAAENCAREHPKLSTAALRAAAQLRLALHRRKMSVGAASSCLCAPLRRCPAADKQLHADEFCPVRRAKLRGPIGLLTPGCTCGSKAPVRFNVAGLQRMRPKPSRLGSETERYREEAMGLPHSTMTHYAGVAIYYWLETSVTATAQCLRELVSAYTPCAYERDDGGLKEWIEHISRPGYTCPVAAEMRINVEAYAQKARDWKADPEFWDAPMIQPDLTTRLVALVADCGYGHVEGYWYCTDISGCLATRTVHDLFDWRDDLASGEPGNMILQCIAAGESRSRVKERVNDCIAWMFANALLLDYMTVGTMTSVWYTFWSGAKTRQQEMLREVACGPRVISFEAGWEQGARSGAITKCRTDLIESGLSTLIQWFDTGSWGEDMSEFAEECGWFVLGWPESGSTLFTLMALDILVCRGDVVDTELDRVWERVCQS